MADDHGPGDHVMVTVDPARNGGSASLSRRMVPLPAALGLLLAGEPLATVRDEYDLTEAEGRVVEALAELVRELSAPAAERDYLTAALDELVAYARRRADGHRMGAESHSSIQAEIADEQTQWVRAFTAVASLVRGLNPGELLHEWKCPACGATTRARMADYPGGGR